MDESMLDIQKAVEKEFQGKGPFIYSVDIVEHSLNTKLIVRSQSHILKVSRYFGEVGGTHVNATT